MLLKGVTPEPLDVAHAALFLASDEARFLNGANLFIDGGYNVTNPSFSIALEKISTLNALSPPPLPPPPK